MVWLLVHETLLDTGDNLHWCWPTMSSIDKSCLSICAYKQWHGFGDPLWIMSVQIRNLWPVSFKMSPRSCKTNKNWLRYGSKCAGSLSSSFLIHFWCFWSHFEGKLSWGWGWVSWVRVQVVPTTPQVPPTLFSMCTTLRHIQYVIAHCIIIYLFRNWSGLNWKNAWQVFMKALPSLQLPSYFGRSAGLSSEWNRVVRTMRK